MSEHARTMHNVHLADDATFSFNFDSSLTVYDPYNSTNTSARPLKAIEYFDTTTLTSTPKPKPSRMLTHPDPLVISVDPNNLSDFSETASSSSNLQPINISSADPPLSAEQLSSKAGTNENDDVVIKEETSLDIDDSFEMDNSATEKLESSANLDLDVFKVIF